MLVCGCLWLFVLVCGCLQLLVMLVGLVRRFRDRFVTYLWLICDFLGHAYDLCSVLCDMVKT